MKKIFRFLLPLFLLLSSCSGGSLKKDTTIVLNVTSEVTPTFSANFGTGSYEGSTYTHHISYLKDLYIYLSYEGLSTETVYIPTSEMTSSTIRKDVTFGQALKSKITLKGEYIDDISKATIETDNKLLDTKYDEKNKKIAYLTFSGRHEDIDLTVKATDYKDYKVHISKEYLRSGMYTTSALFLKEGQIGVTVNNSYAEIYEYPRGNIVKRLNAYNGSSAAYVLDDTKQYYARYYDDDVDTNVHKLIDKTNGLVINGRINKYGNYNFDVALKSNPEFVLGNLAYAMVDFNNNTIYSWTQYSASLSTYGFLFQDYSDPTGPVYYIDNLANEEMRTTSTRSGDVTERRLLLNELSTYPTVSLDINLYDYLAKDTKISTSHELRYQYLRFLPFSFANNCFTIDKYQFRTNQIRADIYDQNNNKVYEYLGNFNDGRVSTDIVVNEKEVMLEFNVILDYLIYDAEHNYYTYPNITIDTSKSYIKLFENSTKTVPQLLSVYDMTTGEYLDVVSNIYFAAVLGHSYAIDTQNGTSYNITVEQIDLDSGFVFTNTQNDYRIKYMEEENIYFNNDDNNYIYEIGGVKYIRSCGFNIYINYRYEKDSYERNYSCSYQNNPIYSSNIIDLTPYYGVGLTSTESAQVSGDRYIFTTPTDGQDKVLFKNNDESMTFRLSDFEYNQDIHAYGLKHDSYRIIRFEGVDYNELSITGELFNSSYIYYCSNDAVITYKGTNYDLALSSQTYINASAMGDDLQFSSWSL